jgi:acyl-coenzyme A thioesterase PaaI-like protein
VSEKAFQDHYPEHYAQCYGCGRLNEKGLQIKSRWEGDEAVCRYAPRPEHLALPGYVYGGLIASLIDCHATGTAAAARTRDEGLPLDPSTIFRYVTASLKVDYLAPTPIDAELELRARAVEIKGKKVVLDVSLAAAGQITARGHVVCVQAPEGL